MRKKLVSKGMMNKCRSTSQVTTLWDTRLNSLLLLPPQWAITSLTRCRYIDKMLHSLKNRRTWQPHNEQRKKNLYGYNCSIWYNIYPVFDLSILLKRSTISHFSLQQLKHWQHWLETNFLQNARWMFSEKLGVPNPLSQPFLSRRRIICSV